MNLDTFSHYRTTDYRRMPWKDGGGTTTELAIEPPGATLDGGFLWRLSMAEVGVSGPFSRFEGYDRTLLLLEGRGLRLEFEGREPVRLVRPLEPVAFPGELRTMGMLLAGPCRDFNVITARERCRHRLEILALGSRPRPVQRSRITLVFCAEGRVAAGPFELEARELLRVEGPGTSLELHAPVSGTAIVVGIDATEGEGSGR